MDPLSITTGALALITTITKVSYEAGVFVKKVRDARNDLDNVSRELFSLSNILELLVEDTGSEDRPPRNLPDGLQKQIGGIIKGCEEVVKQVEDVMAKYEGGGMRKGIKWAMGGKNDMDKLQKSLEAHKTALDLALDMVQLTVSKEIKDDTTEIKGQAAEIKADTGAIRDDTALILAEIARLQERIESAEQVGPGRTTFMLDKYLDGLTTYAETVIDGAFSDDGSLDFSSRPSSTISDAHVRLPPHENLNEQGQLEKLGEDHADLEALGAPPSYFEATTKRRAEETIEGGEASTEIPASASAASPPAAPTTPAPPVPTEHSEPIEPSAPAIIAPPLAATPAAVIPSSSVEKAPLTNIEDDLQSALKAMKTQSNYNSKGFHPVDSKLPSSALMGSFDSLLTGLPKNVNAPLTLPVEAPKETRVYLAQDSSSSNNVPAPNELAKAKGERFLPNWFSQPSDAAKATVEPGSVMESATASEPVVPESIVVPETTASAPMAAADTIPLAVEQKLASPAPSQEEETSATIPVVKTIKDTLQEDGPPMSGENISEPQNTAQPAVAPRESTIVATESRVPPETKNEAVSSIRAEQASTQSISSLTSPWDNSFPIPVNPEQNALPARSLTQTNTPSSIEAAPVGSFSPAPSANYHQPWQTMPHYPPPMPVQYSYQQPQAGHPQQQYYPPPPHAQQPYYSQHNYQYGLPSAHTQPLPFTNNSPSLQSPYGLQPSQYQQYQQPSQLSQIHDQQLQQSPHLQPHRPAPPLPAKRPLSRVISNPNTYIQQYAPPRSNTTTNGETNRAPIAQGLHSISRTESLPVQKSAAEIYQVVPGDVRKDVPVPVNRYTDEPLTEEVLPVYDAPTHDWSQNQSQSNDDARNGYLGTSMTKMQRSPPASTLQPAYIQRRSTSPLPSQQPPKPMDLPPPPPLPLAFRTNTNISDISATEKQSRVGHGAKKDAKKLYTKDPDVVNKGRFLAPGILLKKNYSGPAGNATAAQQRACQGMIVKVVQEHRFRRLKHHDALNLEPGDKVKILRTFDGTWWLGRREKDNKVGWVAIPFLNLNQPELDPEEQVTGARPASVVSSHSSGSDPRRSQPSFPQQAFEAPPKAQDQPMQAPGMLSSTYNLLSAAATHVNTAHQTGVSELLSAARTRRERRAVGGLAARLGTAAIAAGSSAASNYMAPKPDEKDTKKIEKELKKAEKEAKKEKVEHTEPALLTAPVQTASPLPPPAFEAQPLFHGNRVVDIPLPKRLQYLARGDTGKELPAEPTPSDKTEFTHIRCSEITCAPLSLAEDGFALRPQLYATSRETKLLIVLEIGKHDDVETFVRKLLAMYDAIEHLCTPEAGRTVENWAQDSWKNVVLFIFDKGYWKSPEITQILKDIGLIRDWTSGEEDLEQDPKVADHVVGHPTVVEGRDVRARLFEHTSIAKPTTAKGAFTGTRSTTIPTQTILHTRLGELPDIHMKDLRRNDALPWINGLSSLLQPSLCIYVQSTCVELPKNSLVRTWKEFETRKLGGKPTSNFPNTACPTIDFLQLQAGFWKKMWGGGGGGEWHEVQPVAGHEKINRFQLAVNKAKEAAAVNGGAAGLNEQRPASALSENRLSANGHVNGFSPRSSNTAIELPAPHRSVSPAFQQEHKAAWDAIVAAELPADQVAPQAMQAPRPRPFVVRAIFAFQPDPPYSAADIKGPDADLAFQEGQLITVVDEPNHEWFRGWYVDEAVGIKKEGVFPQNFVERI